jgi:histidinol-phosphate aminotransferase
MDEAYQPFASRSYIDRIHRAPHVLLMRTLSKFGLAGVRLGYMMGPKALIAEIDKVRPPYNISVLNCRVRAVCAGACRRVRGAGGRAARAARPLLEALACLPGVQPFPSEANMILVRVPTRRRPLPA